MDEMEQFQSVEIDGQKMTLAQLAGLDMTNVGEKRFQRTPKGLYVFEVVELEDEVDNKKIIWPDLAIVKERLVAIIPCKIVDLSETPKDFVGNPMDLINTIHRERQQISTEDSFKYVNALLTDIGLTGKGPLRDMLKQTVGLRFQAKIRHRIDENDSDKIYVSLDRDRVIPMVRKTFAKAA